MSRILARHLFVSVYLGVENLHKNVKTLFCHFRIVG